MIIPSIDLMNGKVVQLEQGKEKKIELDESPLDVAKRFSSYEIAVIDLDAAMGKGSNKTIIKRIAENYNCRVGGGIRTVELAEEYIEAGAKKIIVGPKVFDGGFINKSFLAELNEKLGKDKIIIAIDTKKGTIVIKGWSEDTGIEIKEIITELEPYCSEFLCTVVDKEGMMQGTDLNFFRRLRRLTTNAITAAGGISSSKEIETLEKMGINSQLGMALYTGKIKI